MNRLFTLSGALKHDFRVEEWLSGEPYELFSIARVWFSRMRECGDDVTELMHDGFPVACVEDTPFSYISVFSTHVNVGFFLGATLNDPFHLLEGTGKRMRHVKVKPDGEINSDALIRLIEEAYADIRSRLEIC